MLVFEQIGDEVSSLFLSIRGKSDIPSIAFSSNGTRIVSGSEDKSAGMGWVDRRGVEEIDGNSRAVSSVGF